MKFQKLLVSLLAISFLVACLPLRQDAPVATPTASTPTNCPYSRNPGPPPPEVETRAKESLTAMAPQGIRGTLKVEANGEYSCSDFLVEDVNFEYTLYVTDLSDKVLIQEYVAKVKESAKESLQGWNMGYVKVRFVTGEECYWDDLQNACTPVRQLFGP